MQTKAPAKRNKSYIKDNGVLVRFNSADFKKLLDYALRKNSQVAPCVREIVLRELGRDSRTG